jgi:hypothetical protein
MRKILTLILLNLSGLVPSAFAQARHASLSDQKMCAAQAKKAFLESDSSKEWNPSDKIRNVSPPDFTSHFDPTANVCYVLVSMNYIDDTKTIWTSIVVYDAFEGRGYANYLWHTDKVKKYWEQPPMACSVKPRGQPEILCKSSDEFNELIDKHFGIGRSSNAHK